MEIFARRLAPDSRKGNSRKSFRMALADCVFTPRVAEYQNSAIADRNYENDNGQMFRMSETSNYQDLQTNRIPICQKLAPTSKIEFTTGPSSECDQVLSSGVVRLSL